jgi:tellurite resistance protein
MQAHHRALIYTMVIVSAAIKKLSETELSIIGDIVGDFPVFRDFDREKLPELLNDCVLILDQEKGLEQALAAIRSALPPKLRETAYAIACDLVAADGERTPEELEILRLLRSRLEIDRLAAAAIERAARARFQTL